MLQIDKDLKSVRKFIEKESSREKAIDGLNNISRYLEALKDFRGKEIIVNYKSPNNETSEESIKQATLLADTLDLSVRIKVATPYIGGKVATHIIHPPRSLLGP